MMKREEVFFVPVADKPLLEIDEAAALTGLSSEFLRERIEGSRLRAFDIEGAYRIRRSDLDQYIAGLR